MKTKTIPVPAFARIAIKNIVMRKHGNKRIVLVNFFSTWLARQFFTIAKKELAPIRVKIHENTIFLSH